jgi:hypothetical protein
MFPFTVKMGAVMQATSVFRWSSLVAVAVISVLSSGCEELDQAAGNAPAPARPMNTTIAAPTILAPDTSTPKQPSTANKQSTPPADTSAQSTTSSSEPNQPDAAAAPMPEGDTTVKKAEGTDGVKGSGYGGGVVTEPVSQYFRLQNRIQFEIQIPKQMQIWKAINNRFPKDEAEYEKEILIPCGINGFKDLPELPMNCRYIYDPKTGDLLVETKLPG